MAELIVTRLLQNPLGGIAPPGERGDIVRVSNGAVTIYLDPAEFAAISDRALRSMLAAEMSRAAC